MGKYEDTFNDIMSGRKDNNIRFGDVRSLLDHLGFEYRISGDHFIYYMPSMPENINIQPLGSKAKAYQVKQIRRFFTCYKIDL